MCCACSVLFVPLPTPRLGPRALFFFLFIFRYPRPGTSPGPFSFSFHYPRPMHVPMPQDQFMLCICSVHAVFILILHRCPRPCTFPCPRTCSCSVHTHFSWLPARMYTLTPYDLLILCSYSFYSPPMLMQVPEPIISTLCSTSFCYELITFSDNSYSGLLEQTMARSLHLSDYGISCF